MKWWPDECRPGDMIRIRMGSFFHYGIFVSEEEVIQFGHPLRDRTAVNPGEDIHVFVTTAAEFATGSVIEVARLNFRERLRRFSRQKTISIARQHLGESGYDILHNNCEHFANLCVFGKKTCSQADQVLNQWRTRPVLDVYLCPVEDHGDSLEDLKGLRREQMAGVSDPALRNQKHTAWNLLEYAMMRSFGQRMDDVSFSRSRFGKWSCDKLCFSISHTDRWVAVAVSNKNVGLDIEETEAFIRRDPSRIARLICTRRESSGKELTPEQLLRLWISKESIYKHRGKGRFVPSRIEADDEQTQLVLPLADTGLAMAVTGENIARLRLYRYDAGLGAQPINIRSDEVVQ